LAAAWACPGYGFGGGIHELNGKFPGRDGKTKDAGGFGVSLKDDYRRFYGIEFGMAGRGVGMARIDNYCELIQTSWTNTVYLFFVSTTNGTMTRSTRQNTCSKLLAGSSMKWGPSLPTANLGHMTIGGWKPRTYHPRGRALQGWGTDPRNLCLTNGARRTDCKNLFVVDGASHVQQSDKNANLDHTGFVDADEQSISSINARKQNV
jgi:hypothetical protein